MKRCGDYDYDETLLSPYPVVIDAGANTGEFCLPWLDRHGGVVIAMEPNPGAFGQLVAAAASRLASGQRGVLAPCPAALGPAVCRGMMNTWQDHPDRNGFWRKDGLCDPPDGTAAVQVTTLSRLLQGNPRIDLLKMDIEGSEYAVLASLTPQEAKAIRQITLEVHSDVVPGMASAVDMLHGLGYTIANVRGYGNRIILGVRE